MESTMTTAVGDSREMAKKDVAVINTAAGM
jgi:hypothetical protein